MCWNRVNKISALLLVVAVSAGGSVRELYLGGGYGTQFGVEEVSQDNGSADLILDFYAVDWKAFRFSLGLGYSYLWTDLVAHDVNVWGVVPSARFYFSRKMKYQPFIFAASGLSYLSETRLGNQDLGGHFAFNDFFGIGIHLGHGQQWTLGYCWRHVSNAGLFKPNDGFDIPVHFLVSRTF